jgi:uncharacterized protein YbjQ (UPF0145 family)
MKKVVFGCLGITLIFVMSSCRTAALPVNAANINIANPYIGFAPLTPENYTILGSVSGRGKISYNSAKNTYSGDTFKHGSLGELSSAGHLQNVTSSSFMGLMQNTQTIIDTPRNSREMAVGNATYELIEMARSMNADAIIFVQTSVETTGDAKSNITTTSATVRGIAIRLK